MDLQTGDVTETAVSVSLLLARWNPLPSLVMPEGVLVVFDTGGGSTQFTFGQGSRVEEQFSVGVGYDPNVVHGTILDRAEIDRQIEMYRSCDAAQRNSIVGLQPKRADVILAGACIVKTVMDKLGKGSMIVSDRGLRHGVLVERFG